MRLIMTQSWWELGPAVSTLFTSSPRRVYESSRSRVRREVGGVWYHNRYPGARVDIESYFYCFPEEDLYPQWSWKERYPAQPEILANPSFAADTWGIRPYIRFSTWVTGAQWEPDSNRYRVTASTGESVTARYLIMAGGQLSKAKTPIFRGLEDFRGRWVQTAHWPADHVDTAGKRIAVIGTGSSGVQVVPALARDAANVTVFHRTANYSVPAQNGVLDQQKYSNYANPVREMRRCHSAPPRRSVLSPSVQGRRARSRRSNSRRSSRSAGPAVGTR